ncbi:MAG: DNA polymerase III subunit gamma/tau [Chromatiales bacterium]|nr:DNA polymerase III subunit gamma/tau [Chromatiales bacterium]
MSYQVLARKWRPRVFADLVGQEHVVRTLSNGLTGDRLHHAFLFTGTRGVGKTTIARIFAKALNCETGVTAEPCGQCPACREIDEGRFVDLLELDAASRTGVDSMRELLDNVQYTPSKGRYKVYLIDEVHMLSLSAFNALLKTLEEPPPHVKFLLATTDPQKIPVTILSRCLQFNLKRLGVELIRGQMTRILQQEGIVAEESALAALAVAADGSMRDGLSLLDQAIAYGGGQVNTAEVSDMLGTVAHADLYGLLDALSDGDGAGLLDKVDEIASHGPDFEALLKELVALLHRIALAQLVVVNTDEAEPRLRETAARLTPEDVQLYYQIALGGRRDLPFAADPRAGFEMTLLRMLAFRPAAAEGVSSAPATPPKVSAPPRPASPSAPPPTAPAQANPPNINDKARGGLARAKALLDGLEAPASPVSKPRERDRPRPPAKAAQPEDNDPAPPPWVTEGPPPETTKAGPDSEAPSAPVGETRPVAKPAPAVETRSLDRQPPDSKTAVDWFELTRKLPLDGGVARELAQHSEWVGCEGGLLRLRLEPAHRHLRNARAEARLRDALASVLGEEISLDIEVAEPQGITPAQRLAQIAQERQKAAERSIDQDSNVRGLIDRFGARVAPDTIKPID